jgi:hypothetical protein
MSKRFFYTDALAAAWQVKHHGFKIQGPVRKPTGEIGESIRPMPVWILARAIEAAEKGQAPEDAKYYVSDDSLHLLHPQLADLAWWKMRDGGGCLCETTPMLITQGGMRSIIQRNGLGFHWPESEEA